MISAELASKMVPTDSQAAAVLIGVGGSITALSALTYILESKEDRKKIIVERYVWGEFAQNMSLIPFIALPIFRNLWKVEAPLPLKFVSFLAYGALGSVLFHAGYKASSVHRELLNKNEESSRKAEVSPEGSLVNLAFKILNTAIMMKMFYEKPADRMLTTSILVISMASCGINWGLFRRSLG